MYCMFPCDCSTCTGIEEPMDVDEPTNLTPEKIGNISRDLRNNPEIPDEAILHAAKQIIFKQGGTDARLVMNKLVENPKDLSVVREVLNELDKDQDVFDTEMFLHNF